jgi:glycosyltransferase involved in cell wall biosynthesis
MSSKISIVQITWNGLKYIEKTIPKLLDLNYSNIEYIWVDNGSTDGSTEYLEKVVDENKERKEVKLIRNK